jgi:hypothetical protein
MAQFPPDYFSDLVSGVHQLKRLRITEVSSVDRGANAHATVVLRKQYEAEHPDYPKWEPEKYQKEQEMRKADHPFEHIEHLTIRSARARSGPESRRCEARLGTTPMPSTPTARMSAARF